MPNKKVVIIGGGFGGMNVAKTLSNTNYDITIIDKANHHLFQPLLYQVATAALSPGDIATPIRSVFTKQANVKVVLGEVVEVSKTDQVVQLAEGDLIPFDYLVIATGAEYNYFGNEDWKKHAPGLKSLDDALKIRERILVSLEKAEKTPELEDRKPYLTFVVIGGGPTGVEMAGSIAEIAKRNMMRDYRNFHRNETTVYLVEAAGGILNGFSESLSDNALDTLTEMGVRVLLNTPVEEIRDNGVKLKNQYIETPNIMWAAGVAGTDLTNNLGEETDRIGRVKVNEDLSIPDHPNIFVIGDAAYFEDEKGNPLPGVAPVAMQQGKYVGNLLKNALSNSARKPFKYLDKGTMATIGRAKAVADIRGFKLTGFFAWLIWGVIHIFFLIGFRNRFRVFGEWIWHYITFKRGVRLIAHKENRE
ncbi:MAG: NAD(P)/FAD-dependent oxidoreductase [Balneolaceae bacterium]|nr:NAD(P)/FAD-dependent oxidoreductase [Balneolaceae bacterium]